MCLGMGIAITGFVLCVGDIFRRTLIRRIGSLFFLFRKTFPYSLAEMFNKCFGPFVFKSWLAALPLNLYFWRTMHHWLA